MNKIKAFIFTHGHMDIEWYQPMRSYRFWLAEALNRQLAMCAADDGTVSYTVDGQIYPVMQYLELYPERRRELKRLVESKKLNVGPFFTQFDEWLPSGESMVRNCLYGDRLASQFGKPMKAGYLPDNFGHPIQLPQILRGFGIDSLIFMRGMPYVSENFPDEFIYRGMDGSELVAVTFRSSYSHIFAKGFAGFQLDKRDTPYYKGYLSYESYLALTSIDDVDRYAEAMIFFVNGQKGNFLSGVVPVVIGCDHAPPHKCLRAAIDKANGMQDEIEFLDGSPEDYIALVRRAARGDMPVLDGELIGTRFQYILLGALSTRSYLKRANFACESLLEKYAEPLCALAGFYGLDGDDAGQLDDAWKLLLTNHAHDSIHGSSTDEVHEEMTARNNIILQTAAGLTHNALAQLSAEAERWWDDSENGILCYSPHVGGGRSYVQFWCHVGDRNVADCGGDNCFDNGRGVRFFDSLGRERRYQVLARPKIDINEIGLPVNRPNPAEGYENVIVELDGGERFERLTMTSAKSTKQPARAGHTTQAEQISHVEHATQPEQITQASDCISAGADYIENAYLKVAAAGSLLNIFDKTEDQWYHGMNLIEETAEAGDYWDTSPTWIPSETVLSNRFPATAEILEAGPLRAIMRINYVMNVPKALNGGLRSAERVDMPVGFDVTLYRGARRAEINLTVENTAKDHKLSLVVEPQVMCDTVKSQNAFCILDRPVVNAKPEGECVQPPTNIFPFREWLALGGGERGMAVACKGMYDYEPYADRITNRSAVKLTMLRAVGNMNRINTKMRMGAAAWNYDFPGGQCPGAQEFEYAFIPYSPRNGLQFIDEANAFLYPPVGHVVRAGTPVGHVVRASADNETYAATGARRGMGTGAFPDLPFNWTAKNIVLSAFKPAYMSKTGDGSLSYPETDTPYKSRNRPLPYILRLFENQGIAVELEIALKDVSDAWLCDMNETPVRRLEINSGKIIINVAPYKIITLALSPN